VLSYLRKRAAYIVGLGKYYGLKNIFVFEKGVISPILICKSDVNVFFENIGLVQTHSFFNFNDITNIMYFRSSVF
jgi:hypothetical protein